MPVRFLLFIRDVYKRQILNFNTPETINALGTATSSIAQMCLSEIARTVLSLERQAKKENRTFADTLKTLYAGGVKGKEPERSVDNERNHIQQAGRVQPTESASAAGNGGTDRKKMCIRDRTRTTPVLN